MLLFLLSFKIQLTGSAPSVSNFASYSGVLTVTIRWGAALVFAVGAGAVGAGCVLGVPVCVADGLADGEGVAPGLGG